MFRFYSFLSPNGVPEPAALALAQPIFHEWSRTDAGNLLLEVLGLDVDRSKNLINDCIGQAFQFQAQRLREA